MMKSQKYIHINCFYPALVNRVGFSIEAFQRIYNRNALLYLLLFTALNYCYLNGLSSS